MAYPGWEIWVKCRTRSSPWPGLGFGEWTSNARLVMTGSMLPVACGPMHCLFGEWCSAVKCWPSWQQFRCPFGPMAGSCLARSIQSDWHRKVCGGRGGEGGGGSDTGEELLAEHPGARPGLLPTRGKTSSLTPRSSRLCGDRDLSLHLNGQQHPIAIHLSLNNLAHRTALKTNIANIYFDFFSPVVQCNANTVFSHTLPP